MWNTVEHLIDWLIYLLFYISRKNFSLIRRRHHYRWRAAKYANAWRSGPLSREGSLSCHTCYDTGPRFFWSHPKDLSIQSPLTTLQGMWRIYSNPDHHAVASYDTQGMLRTYSYPDPHGCREFDLIKIVFLQWPLILRNGKFKGDLKKTRLCLYLVCR
jgi:hypothetical protein